MGGEALYGGASMRRSAIDGLPGGLEGTLQALGRMEADRVLEWRLDQVGTQLVGEPVPVDRLPVDWHVVDAARDLEIARLDAVERYARGHGCRRRALLDYFSDDSDVSCGGCDFCDRLSRQN
jgi:hypothetical protein